MNWTQPPERRRETESKTIVYEPVFEHESAQSASERQQRRRDELLDCGYRALVGVIVAIVSWVGLWIFFSVPEHYFVVAFVAVAVATFAPLLADVNHRNRQSAMRRALDDLNHQNAWETNALTLQRSQHSRSMFAVESQTQAQQLAHRTEQRQIVSSENRDMDAEYFLTCIQRGESCSKRQWTGRQLPSGAKMTAQRWSEITASLDAAGILVRDGNGSPYRLAQPAAPQAGTVTYITDDAVCTLPK